MAKDEASYRYLAESIRMHPDQETLKGMMQSGGLRALRLLQPLWRHRRPAPRIQAVSALPFASLIATGVEMASNASLKGSSAAQADLTRLDGKVIRLELIGLPLKLYFLPQDGRMTVAADYHGDADITVHAPAASLIGARR